MKQAWKMHSRTIIKVLRIVFSLVLIGWLIRIAGTSNLLETLSGANLSYVAVAVVVANLDRLLMAYKWDLLLRAKGIRLPFKNVVSAYYKASFLGSLFLPTVGADAMRIIEITRQSRRSNDIISSVVIERAIGMVAVFLLGALGLRLYVTTVDSQGWRPLVELAAVAALTVAVLFASLRFGWLASLADWKYISGWRLTKKLKDILISYQDYARHQGVLLFFVALSFLEQFTPIVNSFIISRALHLNIPFVYFLMFIPIIMIAVRLPISFDGFGVREGMYVYLFGLAGVPESQAFLVGFLASLVFRFSVAPFSLYFFLTQGKKVEVDEVEPQVVPLRE